jgi:D-serine deaminase-like pyridoxal phosphate-dependent protein
LPVELVSSGETWTYDIAPDIAGVTEVEGGTYALMSTQCSYMEEFQFAVQILGTVISTPRADVAIGNVGSAALAAPEGVLPSVARPSGITVEAVDLDYIVLRNGGTSPLRRGDTFILYSGQQDIMVDRWDQFIGVRRGAVETVWEITARGCRQ